MKIEFTADNFYLMNIDQEDSLAVFKPRREPTETNGMLDNIGPSRVTLSTAIGKLSTEYDEKKIEDYTRRLREWRPSKNAKTIAMGVALLVVAAALIALAVYATPALLAFSHIPSGECAIAAFAAFPIAIAWALNYGTPLAALAGSVYLLYCGAKKRDVRTCMTQDELKEALTKLEATVAKKKLLKPKVEKVIEAKRDDLIQQRKELAARIEHAEQQAKGDMVVNPDLKKESERLSRHIEFLEKKLKYLAPAAA